MSHQDLWNVQGLGLSGHMMWSTFLEHVPEKALLLYYLRYWQTLVEALAHSSQKLPFGKEDMAYLRSATFLALSTS